MKRSVRIASAAMAALLSGCAGTHYYEISEQTTTDDSTVDGIRYYEPAPFILVHTNGKGGLTATTLWLPDTTRVHVVDPYAWFAKHDATYGFTNGVLTSAKSEVDETIIPLKLIEAAKAVALAAADAARSKPSASIPPPALFRVVASGGKVYLRGGYAGDANGAYRDISITVSDPAKPAAGGGQ
jgi:hypothetical protein